VETGKELVNADLINMKKVKKWDPT
jgi:hypothetical protein